MVKTATTLLTGKALLQKIKSNNLLKRELAKECGYYSVSKDGETRANLADFYNAVLAARGIELGDEPSPDGRGREASYKVSVHQNGQIVIGKAYTETMGLKSGDEFELKLGYKHIHLVHLDSDKAESSEDSDA